MFLLKTATNIYTYTVFPLGSTKSIYILLGQLLQFFIYHAYLSRRYYNFFFLFQLDIVVANSFNEPGIPRFIPFSRALLESYLENIYFQLFTREERRL